LATAPKNVSDKLFPQQKKLSDSKPKFMTTKHRRKSVVLLALLFTLLFYRQNLGLNLLLFETAVCAILYRQLLQALTFSFKKIILLMWLLSLTSVVLVHSDYSIAVHILLSVTALGILNSLELQTIISAFAGGIHSMIKAPMQFIQDKSGINILPSRFPRIGIFLVPIAVISFFMILYASANSIFGDLVGRFMIKVVEFLSNFIAHINGALLFTAMIGLLAGIFIIYRYENIYWVKMDQYPTTMRRIRKKQLTSHFRMPALKNEYTAGIFMLLSLNLLIFVVNIIDISNVWIGFTWSGEDFSSMVHEGTYLLIFAVLASIAVVLYYFRGNLNFYQKKWLRPLAGLWIAQNAILAISVVIRNYHYVDAFSLSHKRIGVFIFLMIVLIGLTTVWIKIFRTKTSWYLFKTNALQTAVVLVIFSTFNWDILIARFNFSRGSEAFVYLEHMASLDDSALPYLIKDLNTLEQISTEQYNKFNFRERGLTTLEYQQIISVRENNFLHEYESRSWLSWNWADYRAYQLLSNDN
jgi:hypothetical protein